MRQAWSDDHPIVWVTRSFLDYRVPVFAALNRLTGGCLRVVYNGDYVPARVQAKLRESLGESAIDMHGEKRLGTSHFSDHHANRAIRIPWQMGLLGRIRDQQPSVLISDGFFQWTAAALWLRARTGVPHVMCYERTLHTERHVQWYRARYRNWVRRYIDAYCCSGSLCGDYIKTLGVQDEVLTYGHMVADTTVLAEAAGRVTVDQRAAFRHTHDMTGVVFLCVGRLVRRKGIEEMLRAWAIFAQEAAHDGAVLMIVGDGPERQDAQAFCAARDLTSVHFCGEVAYDDLVGYYTAADCLVMPTLEDNWSLVVPEAMACRLPIVCSTFNGCWPELVQVGRNGWTCDPRCTDDFARILAEVITGRERLEGMGRESQCIVSEHTPEHAAQAVRDACAIAMAAQGKGAGEVGA